jgi:hypothetical protein
MCGDFIGHLFAHKNENNEIFLPDDSLYIGTKSGKAEITLSISETLALKWGKSNDELDGLRLDLQKVRQKIQILEQEYEEAMQVNELKAMTIQKKIKMKQH